MDPYIQEGQNLSPGQLVDVTIKSSSINGVLQLAFNPEAVKSAMVIEGGSMLPQKVLPGDLIHAKITRVVENGIVCKLKNKQRGVVSIQHCQAPKEDYIKGQMVKARVMGWNVNRQEYVLTFLDFLIQWSLPKMPAIIGQVFTSAKIQRIDLKGLEVALPTHPGSTRAYIHDSDLSDLTSVASRDYRLRQEVTVRITGFQALDGLIIGSLKESVLRSGIVCFDDISPGLISEGTVIRIHPDCVILSIAQGITGLARHSSTLPLNRVFQEGQIVKYRVLKLKPILKQVIISLELKLLNPEIPFLTNWEDAMIGMMVVGYVLAIKSHSVIIAFAGDLHGVLPEANVQLNFQESLNDRFIKNKAVKVWIQSLNPVNQKIILTLIKPTRPPKKQRPLIQSNRSKLLQDHCRCPDGVKIGEIAISTFIKKLTGGGGFLVKLEFGDQRIVANGVLPEGHLDDHPMIQTELKEGLKLGPVIVMRTQDHLEVSRKPCLVNNASTLPRTLDEVIEDMILPGFVSSIGKEFVDVSFLDGVTGRVFANQTPLTGITPSMQFRPAQSVQVRVLKVDRERRRINLTMNTSRLPPRDSMFLRDALEASSRPCGLGIGSVVDVKIGRVHEKEAECEINGVTGVKGYIPRSQMIDEVTDVTACVVDVTFRNDVVLSLKSHLLQKGFQTIRRKKSSKLKNEKYESVVEFICSFYLVVSIPEEDHTLALVSLLDYNLQYENLSKLFREGQRIEVERVSGLKKSSSIKCPIMSVPLLPLIWKTRPRNISSKGLIQNKENMFLTKTDAEILESGRIVQTGDVVSGFILQVKDAGIEASLTVDPTGYKALIPFIDLNDRFIDNLPSLVSPGQGFQGLVIKQRLEGPSLSLRASDGGILEGLEETSKGQVCPLTISRDALQRGDQLTGYVSHFNNKMDCVFVQIAREMFATIRHPHFADEAIQDLPEHFQIGQLIEGTIVSLNYPKIGISLRSGNAPLAEIGQVKNGVVANVLPQGIYVQLEESKIQGLVPKMEIKEHRKGSFKLGDRVKVKVDSSTDGFFLNLRFHDQEHTMTEPEMIEISDEDEEMEAPVDFEQALVAAVEAEHHQDSTENPRSLKIEKTACSELDPSIWEETEIQDVHPEIKLTHNQESQRTEAPNSQNFENEPQTIEDFERLIMSSSNSSYLWIRYMAFFLETGNISKARSTAERALQAIPFRDEKAKMEVWLAYLNLERTQGSPVESIMSLFHKAVLCNDPKKLHLSFLRVLESTKETEVGDLVIKSLHRRCPQSAKAYIQELHYWLSTNRGGKCKETLDRALKLLPKRKQVKVLTQGALLEFKIGLVERGRDIFEGLVSCYPKRMDLWNVYLDQELLLKDKEHARAILERATSLDLGKKRMKGIFRRYLQFESEYGTHSTIEKVKSKAKAYIDQKNTEMETN